MTPSRSRNTARRFSIATFLGLAHKITQRLRDRPCNRRTSSGLLAMDMRQPSISRDHIEHYFASLELKSEIQLAQTGATHGLTQSSFVLLAIQHEEATTTGTGNLAADGTISPRQLIPGIDLRIGDAF